MPPKFHLSLLIHAHQPAGNFEDVFERCYQRAYLPFVQHLEKHQRIRAALLRVLEAGAVRTRDLGGTASTTEFTDAICREIDKA